jgi:Patatin-like phospholipase
MNQKWLGRMQSHRTLLLLVLYFALVQWGMTWSLRGCSPSSITALQFAGEPATLESVLQAFNSIGLVKFDLISNTIFDLFFVVFYWYVLIVLCEKVSDYFGLTKHSWLRNNSNFFKNFVRGAVAFDVAENILLLFILFQWSPENIKSGLQVHTSIPVLITRAVFWLASAKMFSIGVALWYILGGFVRSPRVRGAWEAARWCGFSIFAAIVGPGLLTFGEQGKSIFIVIQERYDKGDSAPLRWTCIAIVVFSLMCWGFARGVAQSRLPHIFRGLMQRRREDNGLEIPGDILEEDKKKFIAAWIGAKQWTPRICGILPSITLAKMAFSAAGYSSTFWWVCISGIISAIWILLVRNSKYKISIRKLDDAFLIGLFMAGIILAIIFSLNPKNILIFENTGPIYAWLVSFALMIPIFSLIVWIGRNNKIPLLSIILVSAFLINVGDFNDNHGIRYRRLETNKMDTLNQRFSNWLNREKVKKWRKSHNNKPYPVIFVAAAGGGITAASVFSASMQQMHKLEGFEDHLFAISGVSGGSFGAVIYASQRMIGSKATSDNMKKILTTDMLSPTVASLFSPDLLQRFLPWAWSLPDEKETGYTNAFRMDRGRVLDLSLEDAVGKVWGKKSRNVKTTLTEYAALSAKKPELPVLFLNATEVESGERMVMSTVRPDQIISSDKAVAKDNLPFETLYDVDPQIDLPLSTAASVSARFPGFSPPGFLPQQRKTALFKDKDGKDVEGIITVKRRYVDGGYNENSGVLTLMDVITALDTPQFRQGVDWVPVVISIHPYGSRQLPYPRVREGRAERPRRSLGFDEIMGPILGFFNGWGGPPGPVLDTARIRYQEHFIELYFPEPKILGWYLSGKEYDGAAGQAENLLNSGDEGKRLKEALTGEPIHEAFKPIIGPDR